MTFHVLRIEGRTCLNRRGLLANQALEMLKMVEETIPGEDVRVCNKCAETKVLADFPPPRHRAGRIDLNRICRACQRRYMRGWIRKTALGNINNMPDANGTALCIACEKDRPILEFGIRRSSKMGRDSCCLECSRSRDKERYQKYTSIRRESAKWAGLKMRLGITKEQFFRLYDEQNEKCAICMVGLVILGGSRTRACVDHCHRTKKVRGLLCATCNQGIGLLKDSPDVLLSAAQYLRRHGDA